MTPRVAGAQQQRRDSKRARDVVGLVPAAGSATRLGPLPCSKEVLPLPFRVLSSAAGADRRMPNAERPAARAAEGVAVRPVIARLLDSFLLAEIDRALVVVRGDKADVPRAVAALAHEVAVACVVVEQTPSPVHSLARAAPFLRGATVALGFPDILFTPREAFRPVLESLHAGDADVVLGVFPTDQHEKTDMVDLAGSSGAGWVVRDVVIKRPSRGLRYTWSIACWRPRFTELLTKAAAAASGAPLHVGEVLRGAIARGLRVEAVPFDDGEYLDIGTPDDLVRAMARVW
jgi:glucose-1-phosphate thymidylyltransferase